MGLDDSCDGSLKRCVEQGRAARQLCHKHLLLPHPRNIASGGVAEKEALDPVRGVNSDSPDLRKRRNSREAKR